MFHSIYVEKEIVNHPRVQEICRRFPNLPLIHCNHYGELFNRKGQNFRLQKARSALILAKKRGRFILPAPPEYSVGYARNYYFSHYLNCIFDCRYCFLQGMYNSANHLFFINFEDFQEAMRQTIEESPNESIIFYSGYDCDSLALEKITHFVENFLPFFALHPHAFLELRTKSVQTRFLLEQPPLDNCIIAFTLSPTEVIETLEHRTPRLSQRLKAVKKLQKAGWKVGLRIDPLIYCDNFKEVYTPFLKEVFEEVDSNALHSVSLGSFRLPKTNFTKMEKLYPDEPLFCHGLEEKEGMISYKQKLKENLLSFCSNELLNYTSQKIFYPCEKI